MGCTQTKKEILRSGSGKIYNRKIRRQRKFRSGLHVEKTSEMGAEANFQAAYSTDVDEVYTKVNGNSHKNSDGNSSGNSHGNSHGHSDIPKVLDVVNDIHETTATPASGGLILR